MNSIKWVQASAMMDVIAEKSCNLVGLRRSLIVNRRCGAGPGDLLDRAPQIQNKYNLTP